MAGSPMAAVIPLSAPDTGADRWRFLVGIYGYFPAIEGTETARDFIQDPLDMNVSELFDHMKMNLTGHFEAQHGRFGGGLDFFYVRLGADIEGPIPEFVNARLNLRQWIGEAFGLYKLVQGRGENPWSLDLLGGIRYWNTNARVETDLDDTEGRTIDWVDGFGGLRVQIPLGSRLVVLGRGDVGAGGADLDWSASGDLAFRLGKGWITGAGYRTLNVDYERTAPLPNLERTVWEIASNGPRMWIIYTG